MGQQSLDVIYSLLDAVRISITSRMSKYLNEHSLI